MKAFLTLDYELFMGKNTGSVDNCLLKPMTALTHMLDKYDIKCNIFVDAAYLLRCYQLKDSNFTVMDDFIQVTNHIKLLSKQGHSIQLHFHPQWLYSIHDGKKWYLDFEHYKIDDMPINDAIKFLNDAIDLLQKYSQNKICAFRAGGYSFSENNKILKVLKNRNIYIDTSVIRGISMNSKYQVYNYRYTPKYSSYKFETSNILMNKNGYFIEYPISTKIYVGFIYILKKIKYTYRYNLKNNNDIRWGDGVGIGYPGNKFQQLWMTFYQLFKRKSISATIDGVFCQSLNKVLENNIKNIDDNNFVIIGHPKLISKKSIKYFNKFIEEHTNVNFNVF